MSVEAITWAIRQPIKHSSAKFVLVVLANCASAETGHAFPSVAYLATATGQDRKTVTSNLARLLEWGLIEDTGKRVGQTKQIIVYKLISGPDLFAESPPGKAPESEEKRNSSENGTVPKTTGKSTVFPQKAPQKRYTEPSLTINNRQSLAQPAAERFDEWWEAYPEQKRVGRKRAREEWEGQALDSIADKLIADVTRRAQFDARWLDGYIPDPVNYLADERWNDAIVKPREAAPAPPAAEPKPPPRTGVDQVGATENPLERDIRLAWQHYRCGGIEAEERDLRIAAARARYPEHQEATPA